MFHSLALLERRGQGATWGEGFALWLLPSSSPQGLEVPVGLAVHNVWRLAATKTKAGKGLHCTVPYCPTVSAVRQDVVPYPVNCFALPGQGFASPPPTLEVFPWSEVNTGASLSASPFCNPPCCREHHVPFLRVCCHPAVPRRGVEPVLSNTRLFGDFVFFLGLHSQRALEVSTTGDSAIESRPGRVVLIWPR
jgi:hypothetical protein